MPKKSFEVVLAVDRRELAVAVHGPADLPIARLVAESHHKHAPAARAEMFGQPESQPVHDDTRTRVPSGQSLRACVTTVDTE